MALNVSNAGLDVSHRHTTSYVNQNVAVRKPAPCADCSKPIQVYIHEAIIWTTVAARTGSLHADFTAYSTPRHIAHNAKHKVTAEIKIITNLTASEPAIHIERSTYCFEFCRLTFPKWPAA